MLRLCGDMLVVPELSSNDEMSSEGAAFWSPVAIAAKSYYGSDNLYVVCGVAKGPRDEGPLGPPHAPCGASADNTQNNVPE